MELDHRRYRAFLRRDGARSGVVLAQPWMADRVTVIFVHGAGGHPGQFATVANAIRDVANLGAFLYEDESRLALAGERMREEVLSLSGWVVVVANSLGAFLPAYMGATDPRGQLRHIGVVYLNPLVGGSRWADADRALAVLGEVPGLRWLHAVKRLIQRVFFPPVVQDLAPESDFQQIIFGSGSRASSFVHHSVVVFTERPGAQPDIRENRLRRFFGRARAELLDRMGEVLPVGAEQRTGHDAPLVDGEITLRAMRRVLERMGVRPPS
jgi:hypothetical protein